MFGRKQKYHDAVWAALSQIGLGHSDFPSMNPITSQIEQAYYSNMQPCETALMLFYSIAHALKHTDPSRFDDIDSNVKFHEVLWADQEWVRFSLVVDWRKMAKID